MKNNSKKQDESDLIGPKIGVSIYLRSSVAEQLEELIYNIKRSIPREKRSKLTKSRFFEILIEATLQDKLSKKKQECLIPINRKMAK